MYRILRSDGAVLYDVSNPDAYPMMDPKGTFEIGQPGSLQFSMVPSHPYYNGVSVMETYIKAFKDNIEIFYGRVIDVNIDKVTGIKQVECAGALQFLEDGELSPILPDEEEQQQSSSEEGQNEEKGVQMTAAEFFRRCISDYNSDVQDGRRTLTVGTINPRKAGEIQTYNIASHTQAKSAIESNLISEYGGYLRVRRGNNNALVIDWLSTYDEPNSSPIRLRENVISQENAISAHDFFTIVRPIGKNGLSTTPMVVSSDLLNTYGRIIKTINFSYAETESDLRDAAYRYILDMAKGIGHIGTIKLVDMHFLDHSIQTIRLGSTYTNIAGFEGESMIVSGMELYFATPSEDTITLKNAKELEIGQKGGTSGRGSLSKKIQEADKESNRGFQNIWKHITETEDMLRLSAQRIEINAVNLVETVQTFERYAEEQRTVYENQNGKIEAIQGTAVFQNSDHITNIAGLFTSKYYRVPDATKNQPGRNPHAAGWFVPRYYYITEADIGSGRELFASVEAATAGMAINTQDAAAMRERIGGAAVIQMVPTPDTTAASGTTYYTKSVGLLNGASLTLNEDGQAVNVGKLIKETYEGSEENKTQISLIEGSALWTKRDHITGVCGQYKVKVNPDGSEELIIVSGGGIKILKDGTEFGLYDENNLKAGVVVGLINDPNNENQVLGTKVNINADQVHVGSTSNVQKWMNDTGADINTLNGLIADVAYIAEVNAQNIIAANARIDNIDADYIQAQLARLSTVSAQSLLSATTVQAPQIITNMVTISGKSFENCLVSAEVSQDGKTLTLRYLTGTTLTFNRAVTVRLSGRWNGGIYTVTATADGENAGTISTELSEIKLNGDITKTGNYTLTIPCKVTLTDESTVLTDNITIAARDVYEGGQNSVTLSQGSWSGGFLTVTASNNQTTSVSIPAGTHEWVNTSGNNWRVEFNIGGALRYSTLKDFSFLVPTVGVNSVVLGEKYAGDVWYCTVNFSPPSLGSATSTINLINVPSGDTTAAYNSGWNDCRNEMIESQYYFTYQQGTTHQINLLNIGSRVIDLCDDVTIIRYYVPDAK